MMLLIELRAFYELSLLHEKEFAGRTYSLQGKETPLKCSIGMRLLFPGGWCFCKTFLAWAVLG